MCEVDRLDAIRRPSPSSRKAALKLLGFPRSGLDLMARAAYRNVVVRGISMAHSKSLSRLCQFTC